MGEFAEDDPKFYDAEFYRKTGGEDDRDFTYEGISYGGNKTPDGIALPYFIKEVVEQIADDLNVSGILLTYYQDVDVYRYIGKDGMIHDFVGENVDVEDWEGGSRPEHVYPIGHDGIDAKLPEFAWVEVIKSWDYITQAVCPYCGHGSDKAPDTCPECGHEVKP